MSHNEKMTDIEVTATLERALKAKSKDKKFHLTIRIDGDIFEEIVKLKKRLDTTTSKIINSLLRENLIADGIGEIKVDNYEVLLDKISDQDKVIGQILAAMETGDKAVFKTNAKKKITTRNSGVSYGYQKATNARVSNKTVARKKTAKKKRRA